MTNNQLTDEQIVTLQLRIMSALSFYQQRPEREAKRIAELLMLAGTAASELQERRKADSELVAVREPIAWLNDAYLARGVVDGEAGSEDAGPGYIPVYREAGPQPAPIVPDERPSLNNGVVGFDEGWNACRAAMLLAGNPPVIPDGLIAAVNRLLDSDGSRGCYSAIQCGDAHDEIERLLAAVPQEVKSE